MSNNRAPQAPAGIAALPALLTPEQLRDYLQIADATYYRWLASGNLPEHVVLPGGARRFPPANVQQWLADLTAEVA